MKSAEDFRKEYPQMDDGFRCAILRTLQDLEQKEEKPVKKKWSLGFILALAVMLLGTVAVAASIGQWGLNEFWNKTLQVGSRTITLTQSNPEADSSLRIAQDVSPIVTEYGTITLREHAYDGMAVYVVMDVVPADGVLLLPDSIYSVHDLIPFAPDDEHVMLSAKEFSEQLDRPDIVWLLPTSDTCFWERGSAVFHEDGSATFMSQFMLGDWETIHESLSIWLNFLPYRNMLQDNITQGNAPPRSSSDYEVYRELSLDIPLDYTPPLATANSETVESDEIEGFSASLTMIRTHITTYCVLRYPQRPTPSGYRSTYFMRLLDENGDPLTNGTWEGSLTNDKRMICTVSLDEIPEVVQLGFLALTPIDSPNTVSTQMTDITIPFTLVPQP